ncbi:MAG: hypothetical protein ABDH59_00875 [Fervidobacterium sp.]
MVSILPMIRDFLIPSLLMYTPTNMFDITVPESEKNGKSEDNAVDILNSSLKDFKSGAMELSTSE